jgi:hypothetical protein
MVTLSSLVATASSRLLSVAFAVASGTTLMPPP